MHKTNLATFENRWYDTGAGTVKRFFWYVCNAIFFNSNALLPYAAKAAVLRMFGARIGRNVVIKPHVNIKYPWKLEIGENTWIGEGVWIDNLDRVTIGANACLSQGALILCGNHDYSKTTFDLMVGPISINDGAWIGARSVVTQGVCVGDHAVLGVGSVASSDMKPYTIYRGNPAVEVKQRIIGE